MFYRSHSPSTNFLDLRCIEARIRRTVPPSSLNSQSQVVAQYEIPLRLANAKALPLDALCHLTLVNAVTMTAKSYPDKPANVRLHTAMLPLTFEAMLVPSHPNQMLIVEPASECQSLRPQRYDIERHLAASGKMCQL